MTDAFGAPRPADGCIVRLQLPDADLGTDCVLCGAPASAALPVPEVQHAGWELDAPVCAGCLWTINRPRRIAAVLALVGATMVFPVLFAVCLWAAGVDLKSGRPELHVPFAAVFLAPFAGAAWLVVRGRRLRGVHVVDLDAQSGRLEMHFDDPVIAARIAERNACPRVAATPTAGEPGPRAGDDPTG